MPADVEANMIRQAKNCREPIPKSIQNKPLLREGLMFFLNAFYDLDTERNTSDLERLPWSALNAYGEKAGCVGIEAERFEYLMRYLDNAYLNDLAEKQKQKAR